MSGQIAVFGADAALPPSANVVLSPGNDEALLPPNSPTSIQSRGSQRNPLCIDTTLSPRDRFRSTVRKVIHLHRSATILSTGGVGAEPGVDPRRDSAQVHYGHIRQKCTIEIIDYSSVRSNVERMSNKEFVDLMQNPNASARNPWVKVRWINIGGISWDVVSALALKYHLHPLAIEDILHHRDHSRSKADYYKRHLFLRVACHQIADPNDPDRAAFTSSAADFVDSPRSASPPDNGFSRQATLRGQEPEKYDKYGASSRASTMKFSDIERNIPRLSTHMPETEAQREARVNQRAIEELKKHIEERVSVDVKSMCLFLLRDGTVISIFPTPSITFTNPIAQRLLQRDTLLRTSADPSILVQSILDLIVDRSMQVIDRFHDEIRIYESQVLMKMKKNIVTKLHALSGDLVLLKQTLEPVRALVSGLRQYDLERCAALVEDETAVVGYLSRKSQVYLADVADHAEHAIQSLDMFMSITENLISYTFNMANYEMSLVMRRLTLATIIFLPLTLLTGYCGMNFATMPSVKSHSEKFFWVLAGPIFVVVTSLFFFSDIQSGAHYLQKKTLVRNVLKQYKQA